LTRAGTAIDAGTLTAQGGKMHQVSTVTHFSSDTVYEIKASKLLTTGPNDPGPVTWTKASSGSGSSKSGNTSSRSKGSGDSGSSRSGSGSTDWRQFIPRNAPSHGLPRLPF